MMFLGVLTNNSANFIIMVIHRAIGGAAYQFSEIIDPRSQEIRVGMVHFRRAQQMPIRIPLITPPLNQKRGRQ